MSYAAVAAHNAPPASQQPHPDPALLNTEHPTASIVADDTAKVNVVSPSFRSNPTTLTSEADVHKDAPDSPYPDKRRRKVHKTTDDVEEESAHVWDIATTYLLQPGVAGGLVGMVNVGLLASASHAFYTRPHLFHDSKVVSSTIAATIAVIALEGYGIERYRKTPGGQEEERRAKESGTYIYRHLRQQILRPGVLGGIFGAVNVVALGGAVYLSYANWDRPHWDRRSVSMISASLLALWAGEGFAAEYYTHKS